MEFRDKMKAPITGSTSGLGLLDISDIFPENFPEGLRVLVVDDDATCLLVAKNLLEQCKYKVTTCLRATLALSLLRESRDYFDLVLTDVHMPDMSGIELLERVGIEMDLPVIMMSADSRPSTIIEGIKHGACDYLVKPVRIEELQIIWQHVVRRKFKEYEHSGSLEDSDLSKRVSDGAEYQCSVNDGKDSTSKSHKRKRAEKEDDADDGLVNQHPSSSKKRRVVWTVKLHQEFLEAVNKLGVDKAVPKKILEFMPSSNLTREHVASHLQKYRLYLRKASGVNRQENASHTSFCGSGEQNLNAQSHGRHLFQNLAVSGRIPPQTWPAMNAELSGHLPGSNMLPTMNQPALFQSPMPDHMNNPPQQLTYCQQPSSGQINVSQQFHHSNLPVQNMSSGLPNWSSCKFSAVSSAGNLEGMNHAVNVQPHCAVNIQPSWLGAQSNPRTSFHIGGNPVPMNQTSMVVPSQSLFSFQAGNTSIAISQGSNNISTDSVHDLLPSMPNNVPYGMAQIPDVGTKNVSVPPGTSNGISFDQGQRRNLGFVGEGTCILSQFATGGAESPIPNPENPNMWGTLSEEFSPSDFIDDLPI